MPTIAIIEDNLNLRLFMSVNLEARGYTVLEAETGMTGLKLLDEKCPQLLILDLALPDMEGWEVLQRMAEEDALKTIPVILMTASVNTHNQADSAFPNLVRYLTKPVSVEVLMEAVQNALSSPPKIEHSSAL